MSAIAREPCDIFHKPDTVLVHIGVSYLESSLIIYWAVFVTSHITFESRGFAATLAAKLKSSMRRGAEQPKRKIQATAGIISWVEES